MKSYRVIAVVNDQAKMKMGSSDMLRWNRGMAGRKHSIEVTKNPIDFFFSPQPQKQPAVGGEVDWLSRKCDWRINPLKHR